VTNRPYKELSDKFISKVKDAYERRVRPNDPPGEFNRRLEVLISSISNHLNGGGSINDLEEANRNQHLTWAKNLGGIRQEYAKLYNMHKNLTDEETAIKRIERNAHITALIFRFFTTLGIGIGVLIIYYIAQKIGITMPLIRLI
jgi:hypothetical protein